MNATGRCELLTEVCEVGRSHPDVEAIYGFGSFFRGEQHRDIDLLCVVTCERDELLANGVALRSCLSSLSDRRGEVVDLLIVNPAEFAEAPLRDMEELVVIYRRLSM